MVNANQEYKIKKQLKKAIWLLNAIDLAFRQARKVEEIAFTRVASPPDEIHKIFLSEIVHIEGVEFITKTEKLLKQIEIENACNE